MNADRWYLRHARVNAKPHKAIKVQDVLGFFQQLSTLVQGGTSLLEALRLAAQQSESVRMKSAIQMMAGLVEGGSSLNASMSRHPTIFDDYWVQLVRAGESSGTLPTVITRLIAHLEASEQLKGKIIGSLTYPAILALMSVITLFVMMWKVVPTFTAFFDDFGGKLPGITVLVIRLSNLFADHGIELLVCAGAGAFWLRRTFSRPRGRLFLHQMFLVLPLVGELTVQSSMQRFAANLRLLIDSGVPLLEALEILQTLFRDQLVYQEAFRQVHQQVGRGRDLSSSLGRTGLFTPLVINLTRVGEESGDLAPVLAQIDEYYAKRVQSVIGQLTGLMEPVIVICMGAVIGTILGAIYIPMFSMSGAGRK